MAVQKILLRYEDFYGGSKVLPFLWWGGTNTSPIFWGGGCKILLIKKLK